MDDGDRSTCIERVGEMVLLSECFGRRVILVAATRVCVLNRMRQYNFCMLRIDWSIMESVVLRCCM